jgi:hypothetical protein
MRPPLDFPCLSLTLPRLYAMLLVRLACEESLCACFAVKPFPGIQVLSAGVTQLHALLRAIPWKLILSCAADGL